MEAAAQCRNHTEKNPSQDSTVPVVDDCGSVVTVYGLAHR